MRTIIFCCLFLFIACSDSGSTSTPAPEPTPILRVSDVSTMETDADFDLDITVRITSAITNDITFDYRTEDDTAKAGSDYTSIANTTATIPSGQTSVTFKVKILGDDVEEMDENFNIIFSNVSRASLTNTTVVVTIQNDDSNAGAVGSLTQTPNIPSSGYTTPDNYAGLSLVWSDEFSGTAINTDDWTFETGDGCPDLCGWGNNELQYYQPENVVIHDDKYLVIEARRESVGGRAYSSTRMITKDKKEFTHGRIDIRAVLPEGQGIWPALWMLGANIDNVGWPACGEIDIMELVGHEPGTTHSTVHYGVNFDNRRNKGLGRTLGGGAKFSEEFHVFSLVWENNKMEFFVDDVRFFTFISSDTGNQPYPFNQPFFFIFNIAVGGDWPGNPDATTVFPQQMIVDYVRIFQ